jgi:hypothetical protein
LFGWRRSYCKKKSSTWRRFYTCQWFFLGATSSGRKYLVQFEPDIFLGLSLNCWGERVCEQLLARVTFFWVLGARVRFLVCGDCHMDMASSVRSHWVLATLSLAQWLEVSWVRLIKFFFWYSDIHQVNFHLFLFSFFLAIINND